MKVLNRLKKYFGYDQFKEGQEDLIRGVLSGRDALGIMPTGGGKSLCYQLPATMLDGISLVISPLISLMKDQVDSLNELGIAATYLNSTLEDREFNHRLEEIKEVISEIRSLVQLKNPIESIIGFDRPNLFLWGS